MSEVTTKPLDCYLNGVRIDGERAGKIDLVLRGVKGLGDMCERLSRRVDAWEGSAKGRTGYILGNDVEAEDLRFR